MPRLRALCLGGLVWDELLVLNEFPAPGTVTAASARSGCVGGVGRSALTLARLDHQVTVASQQGRGPYGTLARNEIEQAGITCALEADGNELVSTIVLTGADRTIIQSPHAPEKSNTTLSVPKTPFDLILCATSHTREFLAADRNRAMTTLRTYDAGGCGNAQRVQAALSADVVTGRAAFFEHAAKTLTGRTGSYRDGARALLTHGSRLVAVTDGEGPVHTFTREGDFTVTPPAVVAVDTAGCGDVFHAAVASGTALGHDPYSVVADAAALAGEHAAELGNGALHRRAPKN